MRTHHCGALNIKDLAKRVSLCGWVQTKRDLGGMTFIDLRDRYGITQLVFNMQTNEKLCTLARKYSREFVIKAEGVVRERSNKNKQIPTGAIEIDVDSLTLLSKAKNPPFLIEDDTDGGEELRAKYRYLDLRRSIVGNKIYQRDKIARCVREFLHSKAFIEIETPMLIKSTPEGARDFLVPSRMNKGEFYALPQSPQIFKQLCMVAGMDRYFQLVKCFRDEDLRADRQPEFTQIDCEMAFVQQSDVRNLFEEMVGLMFGEILGLTLPKFLIMDYQDALKKYGTDKPHIGFGMEFKYLDSIAKNKGFKVIDQAETCVGICLKNGAGYSRKQLDELINFVQQEPICAQGLIWVKCLDEGQFKSSVDKFYNQQELRRWQKEFDAEHGDLLLVMAGEKDKVRADLSALRLALGKRMNLLDEKKFYPLWVNNFPLLQWDAEQKRYQAMHHPFTAPLQEDIHHLDSQPAQCRANAYDMVINGVEVGGGSIRIKDKALQEKLFTTLGFSPQQAQEQFGFIMQAFQYGVPPHGGIAFGFDRLVALMLGCDSIKEVIPFPKNNAGRDTMIDAPNKIESHQLDDLGLRKK